jgi:hypothetical protein
MRGLAQRALVGMVSSSKRKPGSREVRGEAELVAAAWRADEEGPWAAKRPGCTAVLLAVACGGSAPPNDEARGRDAGLSDATDTTEASTSGTDGSADGAVDAATPVATPPPDYLWYLLDETEGTTVKDSTSHHFDIVDGLSGIVWNAGGAGGATFEGASTCGVTTVDGAMRSPPITMTAWLTPAERADGTLLLDALLPFPANALSDDVPGVGGYGIGLNVWGDGRGGSVLGVEGVSPCTQAGLCAANATQNVAAAGTAFSCTSASSCNQGFVAGREYFVAVAVQGVGDAGAPADGSALVTAQVYVDGDLFDQDTAFIPPGEPEAPLYLGCCNLDTGYGSERFYQGRMRDVRVYKRYLGSGEIGQLFANGPATEAPVRLGNTAP